MTALARFMMLILLEDVVLFVLVVLVWLRKVYVQKLAAVLRRLRKAAYLLGVLHAFGFTWCSADLLLLWQGLDHPHCHGILVGAMLFLEVMLRRLRKAAYSRGVLDAFGFTWCTADLLLL